MRMRQVWSIGSVPDSCAGRSQGARAQLSRDLVALWADEYGPALELLRHALPPGLMRYLNQPRPRVPLPQPPPDAPPAGAERALSPPSRVLPSAIALYDFMHAAVYGLGWDALRAPICGMVSMMPEHLFAVRGQQHAHRAPSMSTTQISRTRALSGDSGAGPRLCSFALHTNFELHNSHGKTS